MVLSAARVQSGEGISPNNNQREYSVIYLSPNFLLHISFWASEHQSTGYFNEPLLQVYTAQFPHLCARPLQTRGLEAKRKTFSVLYVQSRFGAVSQAVPPVPAVSLDLHPLYS